MKSMKQKMAIALAMVLMLSSVPTFAVNAALAEGTTTTVETSELETPETQEINKEEAEEEVSDGEKESEEEISTEGELTEEDNSTKEEEPEEGEVEEEIPTEGEEEESSVEKDNEEQETDGEETSVTQKGKVSVYSLLPLEEKTITPDLSAYMPVELTMVPFSVIFAGENLGGVDTISYAYLDGKEDFFVNDYSGTANISCNTYYSNYGNWQMIPGGDQLNVDAERYIVRAKITASKEWLIPTVYTQDDAGSRTPVTVSGYGYYDYDLDDRELRIGMSSDDMVDGQQLYLGISINDSLYGGSVADMKVYEGKYTSADEAQTGTEITDQIFSADMNQQEAGYKVEKYESQWITIVSYDTNGKVTGCLPFYLYLYPQGTSSTNYVSTGSMFKRVDSRREYVYNASWSQTENGCRIETYELYAGYAADGTYCMTMSYYQNGSLNNGAVTAAYADKTLYSSIAEAESAEASEVKEALFGDDYATAGYAADYSQGVYFSIFLGDDGTEGQEVYHYCIKTKEGIVAKNSGADVTFTGLLDASGNNIKCYTIESKDDSYGDGSYPTILVDNDVDLTNLAPIFTTSEGVRLYAGSSPDANAVQTSGESRQDFSHGPVQYTTASENGENQKNCWLTVIKTDNVAAIEGLTYKLYTNSLADKDSETYVDDNGVIHSKREVILYDSNEVGHDIFLVNMGTNVIPKLSAELESDTVIIDEYWTLSGNHDLAAYAGTEKTKYYGELPNLAKVRLKAKDGVAAGTEVSGTLTIKADGQDIMVLELTGVTGMPQILTDSIPQAVQYVPYGTMIQNSNKYSENKITYAFDSGTLPDGIEIMSNGEIYGVPKETGKFYFYVKMVCSMMPGHSVTKNFVLDVVENTDANVDNATDEGYTVTQRIPKNISLGSTASHTFVSEGILGEFKKVFLDGEELSADEYEAESGSTRLTISSQTLSKSNTTGRHTLGVEFRTSEDTLRRAAQNFYLTDGSSGSGNSGSNNGNSGNTGNSSEGSSNNDGNDSASGNLVYDDSTNNAGTGSEGNSINTDAVTSSGNGVAAGGSNVSADVITYIVKAGDTLWGISTKYYGDGSLWRKIYEDNMDVIRDVNVIRVGQEIKIYPIQTSAIAVSADESGTSVTTYVVTPGDTLWKISKKLYGKGWQWRKIYDANEDSISDPAVLYVGQVIVIP